MKRIINIVATFCKKHWGKILLTFLCLSMILLNYTPSEENERFVILLIIIFTTLSVIALYYIIRGVGVAIKDMMVFDWGKLVHSLFWPFIFALLILFIYYFRCLSTYFVDGHAYGELVRVFLTALAGIGALVLVYYTGRRVIAMEKENIDTRFNNAVGHLGNTNHSVVLGGIHILHQIAIKHKSYTEIIHNLFCSYLRENSATLYTEEMPDRCPVIIQTLIDYLFKPYNEKSNVYKDYESNLSFSKLKNCIFKDATVTKCDFSNVIFEKCLFNHSVLTNCHFNNTNDVTFTNCEFKGAFISCKFGGTFTNCEFGGTFTNNKFSGNFTLSYFNSGTLIECKFSGIFTQCEFNKTDLTKCDFSYPPFMIKCKFNNLTLTECGFNNAAFTECGFNNTAFLTKCRFDYTGFSKCEFIKCEFSGVILTNSSFGNTTLTECYFLNTSLTECYFKGVKLFNCYGLETVKLIDTKLPPNENKQSENEMEI